MEELKNISIRGRMAYLISSLENMLLYYNCNIDEWKWLLKKIWSYTKTQYLDDWMYELAEYMPNSILEDTMDDAEYITEEEFKYLYKLYINSNPEILLFLNIIFECGTCDLYAKLCDYSINTLKKIEQAVDIMKKNNVDLIDIESFKKYSFNACNGWGNCFEYNELSKFI